MFRFVLDRIGWMARGNRVLGVNSEVCHSSQYHY